MQRLSRPMYVMLAMIIGLGGVLFALLRPGDGDRLELRKDKERANADEGFVEIGGVRRPLSDVGRGVRRPASPGEQPESIESLSGRIKRIPADANPQVQSLAEALRTGENPERISPLISPTVFDKDAYLADPEAYLNTVEPGRVFQPAQPGPGVLQIKSHSPRHTIMNQGESITLSVEAVPDAPVTFKSFDGGAFQNHLTTISVKADEAGMARATFTATSGTIYGVNVVAASPMTAGQLRFTIDINPPRSPKTRAQASAP